MNRRDFFLRTAVTAGAATLDRFPYALYASTTKKNATDRIKLGPMKVEVSRLAIGTGTNGVGGSSNQTRKLGLNGLADLSRPATTRASPFSTPPTSTAPIRTSAKL